MSVRARLIVAALALSAAVLPTASAFGVPIGLGRDSIVTAQSTSPKVLQPVITAAGWFQPDPLCATPLGCGVIKLPAISPYPKGTYHVGTAIGRQIARAFIAVHITDEAAAARGGTLSIPLDTNPTDGSIAPQSAKINVCVTYQAVTPVEGGFVDAPSANCLPAAHAKYVAKPTPHLEANLKRLAGHLIGVKGFALLPADPSPTAAWAIVFKLPTGKVASSSLPQLRLIVGKTADASTPKPPAAHHHHHAEQNTGGSTSGDGDGGFVFPEPTLPPAVTAEPSNPAPVVAGPTKSVGHFVTVSYQYPEVWLLPLLMLVLVPFTLRALTRDLTRR